MPSKSRPHKPLGLAAPPAKSLASAVAASRKAAAAVRREASSAPPRPFRPLGPLPAGDVDYLFAQPLRPETTGR